jgi:hypothetical protein
MQAAAVQVFFDELEKIAAPGDATLKAVRALKATEKMPSSAQMDAFRKEMVSIIAREKAALQSQATAAEGAANPLRPAADLLRRGPQILTEEARYLKGQARPAAGRFSSWMKSMVPSSTTPAPRTPRPVMGGMGLSV